MRRHALAALALAFLATACVPPGEEPVEFQPAKKDAAPAAPKAPADPAAPRPAAKAPFDESRLPESIAREEAPVAALEPAPEMARPVADARYDAAFAAASRISTPPRAGFDVLAIEPPAGTARRGLEVAPDGRASIWFGTEAGNTHAVHAVVAATAEVAREALRTELSGHQGTLEAYAAGDLGFASFAGSVPDRVLFVRGNLFLQAWALGEGSAEDLALALDRQARDEPAGRPGEGAAAPALRVVDTARAGDSIEVAIDGVESELVGSHFSATGDASVTTSGGKVWLLAPNPGTVAIEATFFDRALRRSVVRLEVEVER